MNEESKAGRRNSESGENDEYDASDVPEDGTDVPVTPEIAPLLAQEFLAAKQLLIQQAQVRCFGEDMLENPKLRDLNPFFDENHILRLRGRLENLNVARTVKEPMLLADDPLTRLIIMEEHCKGAFHMKTDVVLTRLRRYNWILRGRQVVRKTIHRCNACKRGRALPCQASPERLLPAERVEMFKVFQNVGVDLAGPFIIQDRFKNESKVWIVLFSCCVIRAVYLDIVEDLSALSFLLALRRFVATHGAVERIISDNGLNFVKADKLLRQLWSALKDESVQSYFGKVGIKWSFNPPRAAWYGGHFERLIGTMKTCLRHALKQRKVKLVQFLTILKEIEAIMNSRPLSVVNTDFDAPETLTPGHFLSGRLPLSLPSGDIVGLGRTDIAKAWRVREQIVKAFWKKWRDSYIVLLKSANKRLKSHGESKVLKKGDVVIIKDESLNRQFWQLGIVKDCIPSRDNYIRKYKVHTIHGDLLREGKHLYNPEVTV